MNRYPIENYLLETLKKCHFNIDVTIQAVRTKYPFFKSNDLRTIIADLFVKKINNYKIGGSWKVVDKKWKMVKSDGSGQGAGFDWSGQDMPASEDTNSLGPARNVYSVPGDRPDGKSPRNKKFKKEVSPIEDYEEEEENNEMQKTYEELYDKFSDSIQNDDDLNKIILDELTERGYGRKVEKINLKKRQ